MIAIAPVVVFATEVAFAVRNAVAAGNIAPLGVESCSYFGEIVVVLLAVRVVV